MKRTLDFSPELENRLQVLAAQNGTDVEAIIIESLEVLTSPKNGQKPTPCMRAIQREVREGIEKRRKRLIEAQPTRQLSGFGAAAHLAPRAADINRDRREEIDREEAEHEMRRAA